MSTPQIDLVVDACAEIGEGALWSSVDDALLWVDVPGRLLHEFAPSSGRTRQWQMPEQIGCCAPIARDRCLVALANGVHLFDRQSGQLTFVSEPKPVDKGHRFSEGTVDPRGRFLAGTSPYQGPNAQDSSGTVYAFGADGPRQVLSGFHTINGMAFSPDGRTAYASDSFPTVRKIFAWDYDLDDGTFHNKRLFFDTADRPSRPDGAAVDSDGCYWMAGVSGWELVRLTPAGRVDRVIAFPVERPSRIAFGGQDLSTMFVTSIGIDLDPSRPQPHAGGLFALTIPGIQGLEMPLARLWD